jgi:hypothetical protein
MAFSAPSDGSCSGLSGQQGEISEERESWMRRSILCRAPKGIYTPLSAHLNPHHLQLHRLYYISYYNALLHHLPRSHLCCCGLRCWLPRRGTHIYYSQFYTQILTFPLLSSPSARPRSETPTWSPTRVTNTSSTLAAPTATRTPALVTLSAVSNPQSHFAL